MASRREEKKQEIRYSNAKEVADKQASGFELSSITLPKGIDLFAFKREGLYKLNVIPFKVKPGNPMCDEGLLHYERTYWAHAKIGPNNKSYCCLAKTFGKKCPVCEDLIKREKSGESKEDLDVNKAKKRQLFQLEDLQDKEKGFQVYEGPYYNGLGELIDAKIDMTEDDDAYRRFHHLEGGLTLFVTAKQDTFRGRTFFKPVNIEMKPRKDLSEDVLALSICLDDLPKELSYNELKKFYDQVDEPEDSGEEPSPNSQGHNRLQTGGRTSTSTNGSDEETPPKKKKKGEQVTAESLSLKKGDFVEYRGLECEIIRISADGTSLTLEDEDGGTFKAVDPAEVKVKEEEEAPAGKKPPVDDDEDDTEELEEEDDEDEEEEERPVKGRRK